MSLRRFFKKYCAFTQGEQRGVLILSVLLLLLATTRWLVPHQPKTLPESLEKHKEPVEEFLRSQDIVRGDSTGSFPSGKTRPTRFAFDPNLITLAQGIQLGLSEGQARNILNYRAKGGKYYQKEDFKKMYTIPESLYRELEPFITLPSGKEKTLRYTRNTVEIEKTQTKNNEPGTKPTDANTPQRMELNEADSTTLIRLRGIGPVLSMRIMRYRKLLGGYVHAGQIKEVYGLRSGLADTLASQLWADSSKIRKINLNTATEKELRAHPYIGLHMAKNIVAYRTSQQKIAQLQELLQQLIVTKTEYQKIRPYLKTE